ncbi:MAG: hypothetical protein G01um101429_203 [Parcubacteria group bacterium Gr01-1014_29]|nr:MAG: hypothetical protein G01um101429_203 [Parcubacteria group bacterium Gr01-1014_29]
MIPALSVFFFSILGIGALFFKHVSDAARMSPEELAGVLRRERPLLTQVWESALNGLRTFWHRYLREKTFTFLVKLVSQVRIMILRIEQQLFRFASRIRLKSSALKSPKEPSEYWRTMHGWRKTVHWQKNQPSQPQKDK